MQILRHKATLWLIPALVMGIISIIETLKEEKDQNEGGLRKGHSVKDQQYLNLRL